MDGRRQLGAGITLLLLSAIVPGGGLETATLITTALLLAVYANRSALVPVLLTVASSVTAPAASTAPAPTRLSPAAPGRPQRPRAPTCGFTVARPR